MIEDRLAILEKIARGEMLPLEGEQLLEQLERTSPSSSNSCLNCAPSISASELELLLTPRIANYKGREMQKLMDYLTEAKALAIAYESTRASKPT